MKIGTGLATGFWTGVVVCEEFVINRIAHTGKLCDLLAAQTLAAAALVRTAGLSDVPAHQTDVYHVVVDATNATAGAGTALLLGVHYITVLLLQTTLSA